MSILGAKCFQTAKQENLETFTVLIYDSKQKISIKMRLSETNCPKKTKNLYFWLRNPFLAKQTFAPFFTHVKTKKSNQPDRHDGGKKHRPPGRACIIVLIHKGTKRGGTASEEIKRSKGTVGEGHNPQERWRGLKIEKREVGWSQSQKVFYCISFFKKNFEVSGNKHCIVRNAATK